jgi:hypothetical protein
MADEPENHTLRLLREMREDNERLHAQMREDNERQHAELREDIERQRGDNDRQHAQTRADLAPVLETVLEMAKSLKAMHAGLTGLRRGQRIVESEMRALRGRVERIEDKMDPVTA